PQHLQIKPRVEKQLRRASAMTRWQKDALDQHPFHRFMRRILQITVPGEDLNPASHMEQRQRFLAYARVRVVRVGKQHQNRRRGWLLTGLVLERSSHRRGAPVIDTRWRVSSSDCICGTVAR